MQHQFPAPRVPELYRRSAQHWRYAAKPLILPGFVSFTSLLGGESLLHMVCDRRLSSHLVTKLYHAALVGADLHQMEGDVSVEPSEEWDPITNHDWQDRVADFVG
jgi:hypothetical protein